MSPDSGLADPLLGSGGTSGASERSVPPQSTIYNWSCGHFSKPLLIAADDSKEILTRREEREKFALEHIAKCQHSCLFSSLILLLFFHLLFSLNSVLAFVYGINESSMFLTSC